MPGDVYPGGTYPGSLELTQVIVVFGASLTGETVTGVAGRAPPAVAVPALPAAGYNLFRFNTRVFNAATVAGVVVEPTPRPSGGALAGERLTVGETATAPGVVASGGTVEPMRLTTGAT